MKKKSNGFYNRFVKRLIDILCSALFLILFCWLYLILAIIVRINLGSPIIFHQQRPGQIDPKTGEARIFNLCKFRSMTDERDENGNLLPDKQRLTKFGRIFRSTSLDELPELFNILKGDMSIVGPRPLLVRYLEHYNSHDMRRQEVRPGLTGLAQVSGRNALTWKERFVKDVEYVDNLSFVMDLKILFLTVKKVFIREGIEFKEGHQTIDEYFKEINNA